MSLRACVIGHPVMHSKSPLIHGYWMGKYKVKGSYEALDVLPGELKEVVQRLVAEKYNGFNVTLPHKEEMFGLCDEIDPAAKLIGAVNTIIVVGKKLRGMNTDVFGFIENIKAAKTGLKFQGSTCVILGAGGAARAAVAALVGEGAKSIKIVNRTPEKTEKIIKDFARKTITAVDWAERNAVLRDADLFVNTTSLGMAGQPPLEISLNNLPEKTVVCDIVYAPLETALIQVARARGNQVVPGIGMLLQQARPAFKAWTGILPAITPELEKMVSQ
jgi:shikimate dehydrogenase